MANSIQNFSANGENKILLSSENNPYINISMEQQLFENAHGGVTLFLWQNQPCVILGRNQNIYGEANLAYLKQHQILPVRRFSGGGTVFHDLGNLNYTFITTLKDPDSIAIAQPKFTGVITSALNSLGIMCQAEGRNDILCDHKKISGQAYILDDERYLLHGTIMVNVDLQALVGAITPAAVKLESKGIKSVGARVLNLTEKLPNLTMPQVIAAICQSFAKEFETSCQNQLIQPNPQVLEQAKKLAAKDWIFGDCPQFTIQLEKRINNQIINLKLAVENGKIEVVQAYTDSLDLTLTKKLENLLVGLDFAEAELFALIEKSI